MFLSPRNNNQWLQYEQLCAQNFRNNFT